MFAARGEEGGRGVWERSRGNENHYLSVATTVVIMLITDSGSRVNKSYYHWPSDPRCSMCVCSSSLNEIPSTRLQAERGAFYPTNLL